MARVRRAPLLWHWCFLTTKMLQSFRLKLGTVGAEAQGDSSTATVLPDRNPGRRSGLPGRPAPCPLTAPLTRRTGYVITTLDILIAASPTMSKQCRGAEQVFPARAIQSASLTRCVLTKPAASAKAAPQTGHGTWVAWQVRWWSGVRGPHVTCWMGDMSGWDRRGGSRPSAVCSVVSRSSMRPGTRSWRCASDLLKSPASDQRPHACNQVFHPPSIQHAAHTNSTKTSSLCASSHVSTSTPLSGSGVPPGTRKRATP